VSCLVDVDDVRSSIAGWVTDPAHAVVPSANVTLTNQGTGIQMCMKTNANGDYMFPIVDPGSYRLRVQAAGFKAYEVSGLAVQVAQPAGNSWTWRSSSLASPSLIPPPARRATGWPSTACAPTRSDSILTELRSDRIKWEARLYLVGVGLRHTKTSLYLDV
jgi:hypothetical protein